MYAPRMPALMKPTSATCANRCCIGICRQSRKLKPKSATSGAKLSRAKVITPKPTAASATSASRRRQGADQANCASQSARTVTRAISHSGS